MCTGFIGAILVTIALSFSVSAQSKSFAKKKKTTPVPEASQSIIEQAQQVIAVDPKSQVPSKSSPQETGILVMRATDLSPKGEPTKFPIGIHLDSYSLSGTTASASKNSYHFSDMGAPLVTSLRLGMIPGEPAVFDAYNLQLGLQQKNFVHGKDDLRLVHNVVALSAENKIYVRGRFDVRYMADVGVIQTQVTNTLNSLSNVTRKANFFGLGLQTQYHLKNSISADLGLSYKYAFAKSDGYELQPIGVGAGISYLW